MNILVTEGAGYIGSHTLIELIEAGHTPIVVDNLANSSEESLRRVHELTGATIPFYQTDLRDESGLAQVFDYDLADLSSIKKAAEDITVPSKKCVQKGELDDYWKRFNALTPIAIYTEDVIRAIRLRLKKNTNIAFAQEDVAEAVQGLLIGGHAGATRSKVLKK